VPEGWKDLGDPCQVRKYYFEEKETGIEFPRAYYVANPNKTEEENKKNSKRIKSLMLKVAKELPKHQTNSNTNSGVVIGEELPAIKLKDITSKKYKWAHSEYANLLAKWESQDNYNLCNKTKGGLKIIRGLTLSDYTLSEIQEKQKKRDLFAVGRYQLIPLTLNQAVTFLKIKSTQKFDEEIQDKIFDDYLIRIKRPNIIKYLEGNGSLENAMYSTAKEWASVGVEKGKKISKGRISAGSDSYYKGDGLNNAHISSEEIKKALEQSKMNAQ
jgi:hypothetical protein